MIHRYLLSLLCIFFYTTVILGQDYNWTMNQLNMKPCFIENKELPDETNKKKDILYFSNFNGLKYSFFKDGIVISRMEKVEKTSIVHSEKKENNRLLEKKLTINFKGINDGLKVETANVLPYYYSLTKSVKGKSTSVRSNAYQKLIYKNIYPKIDMIFEFDSLAGIKYSFILYPGSNPGDIELHFPDATIFEMNSKSLEIKSEIENVQHLLGKTFLKADESELKCEYVINDNSLGYKLPFTKTKKTTIIDPWILTDFQMEDFRFYDIDYDYDGNVYVHFKENNTSISLLKLNETGNLLWIYHTDYFYYGDFAIDRSCNDIYITEGFNVNGAGANVIKINENGDMTNRFYGNPGFAEMWRIAFSACTNQAVIAGGGVSNPTYQTCFLDTALTDLTMIQYVQTTNCCHDVNMLALDEYGNCYQVTNESSSNDGLFDNHLVKLPLPQMLPIEYNVPTGYNLQEAASNIFYEVESNSLSEFENGYNGMATANGKVYTTDGYELKIWNGSNGALQQTIEIALPTNFGNSVVYWGGIAVDGCGNLFVGSKNEIFQYDSAFNHINTYTFPDNITDIVYGTDNRLYVSGYFFISVLNPLNITICDYQFINIDAELLESDCEKKGSAILSITGGTPPYNISWNTTPPQSGTTVSGLSPGEYIVTVNDFECDNYKVTDTIVIDGVSSLESIFNLLEPTNVFTPNSDNSNEVYFPFVNHETIISTNNFETYHFIILNRWGNEVFSTEDKNQGWNGLDINNNSMLEGVYFWKLDLKSECEDEIVSFNGFVHLVK